MNHWSNYRIQQQTANQNAAFVGERWMYKIPGLACRPTIFPSVGRHAGYSVLTFLSYLRLAPTEIHKLYNTYSPFSGYKGKKYFSNGVLLIFRETWNGIGVVIFRDKPFELSPCHALFRRGLNSKSINDLSIRVKPRHLVDVNKWRVLVYMSQKYWQIRRENVKFQQF
jgi:hypothetical protein